MLWLARIKASWKSWLPPAVIVAAYLVYQFSQLSQYGVTWDEPLHRNWGKLFAYFWHTGERQALDLMPGHGIEYGPLFFYANYLVSEWLYGSGVATFVEANHVLTLLVSGLCVGLVFLLGRMIGGLRIALGSVFFFVLFPQFLAHAHYNPKDIPLMAAILATSIFFLLALRHSSNRLFIFFAFLFGASIAVKVNAVLMGPVYVLVYLTWLYRRTRTEPLPAVLRNQLPVIVLGIVAVIVGLYLLWPSAWGDVTLIPRAIRFFAGENFWPGKVLFFGTEYRGAELPWYYIPFEFLVSMPLLTLLAFGAGLAAMFIGFRRSFKLDHFFLLLWVLFPLLFSMKPGLVRYDGIRQFFFVLPAMTVIAAIGLERLLALLKKRARKRFAVAIFVGLVTLSITTQIYSVHPYEGSYRNEILQLLYPKSMDRSFQIEYWGATYKQGMEWLTLNAEPNPVICVPTAGILVTWYSWRPDFVFECSKDADYVMFFTRYSEAGAYEQLRDHVFSIERMKAPLLLIYQVK